MFKKRKVYIAGPMSVGNLDANIAQAVEAAEILWKHHFVPFVPHFLTPWHDKYPKGRVEWLQYDAHWFKMCDILLRLPGESPGSDQEVFWAGCLGMPTFFNVEDLLVAYKRYTQFKSNQPLSPSPLAVSPFVPDSGPWVLEDKAQEYDKEWLVGKDTSDSKREPHSANEKL